MSWVTETWSQDDSQNFGYPFPTDSGVAPEFVGINSSSVWNLETGKFFDYPFIKSGIAPEFVGVNSCSVWKLETGKFFDYPFIKSAGIAPKYGSSTGAFYLDGFKVRKMSWNENVVKVLHLSGTIQGDFVFEG